MKYGFLSRWFGILGWLLWQSGIADNLRIYSDRLLAETSSDWVTHFQAIYPDATVVPTPANTLTAIQALLNRQTELIAIGRALTPAETSAFQNRHGNLPLALPIGLDALGVFVHSNDPRPAISLAELEYLYAGTHFCQRGPPATPLTPKFLYSPAPAQAGYFHFQAKVLCGSSPRREVVLLEDDRAVIDQIARQPGALGLASRSLASTEVRIVPLALSSQRVVLPSTHRLLSGHYPLTYYLYLYLSQTNPLALAFARTVLLPEGQAILSRRFAPLPEPIRQKALERLQQPTRR